MSAIRADTLDRLLADIHAVDTFDQEAPLTLEGALDAYEEAVQQAPRIVLAWHHIRMGLRVLFGGKALP